jgi:dTDP-4-dehydrorhamnose 3,5-epimerase
VVKLTQLSIEGAWMAESPNWPDERGFFREWFKVSDILSSTGRVFEAEQGNFSMSSEGTLRGIHYSNAPLGQAKWITCVSGSIKDVIVDVRPNSITFGEWLEIELRGDSGKAVLISEGLGHGFLALEDNSAVVYLMSTPYSPEYEFELNPFDTEINIDWGVSKSSLILSEKDKSAPSLAQLLEEKKLPYQKFTPN